MPRISLDAQVVGEDAGLGVAGDEEDAIAVVGDGSGETTFGEGGLGLDVG